MTSIRLRFWQLTRVIGYILLLPVIGWPQTTLISPYEQESESFGYSLSPVLDVNGDGKMDLIVGAYNEWNSNLRPHGAYIFDGATGALLTILLSPDGNPSGHFGESVAGIGDVDGDGKGDVLVGDPRHSSVNYEETGVAYIYSGGLAGINSLPIATLSTPHEMDRGWFGVAVASVPDVTGDGREDVLIGASGELLSGMFTGRVYLFAGDTIGTNTLPLLTLESPNVTNSGRFGASVAGISDLNGNGKGEVLVGAPEERGDLSFECVGRAYIFDGGETGTSSSPLATFLSPNAEDQGEFGFRIHGISDLNGDGFSDVIISAPGEEDVLGNGNYYAGRVYLYSGTTLGLCNTSIMALNSPNPAEYAGFGRGVGELPDINGDGITDIIVGASGQRKAYLFDGSILGNNNLPLATLVSPNATPNGEFGWVVTGLPDINGDSRGDVAVGAFVEGTMLDQAGRAYIFPTSLVLPIPSPTSSPSPTPSATPTPSDTATSSPTSSPSPSPSPMATESPSESPTVSPSPTPNPSPTASPSSTPNAVKRWDSYE